jgi:beta-glucanase (GH16 family)
VTSTFFQRQLWQRVAPIACMALLACNSGSAAPRPETTSTSAPAPELKLAWADEFDGPAGGRVDSTKWRYDLGDGCPGNCGWGNQEKESYTSASENISLNGQGQLQIVARTAGPGLTCYYGACRYTSAKITTRGNLDVVPGRVEARIKLPAGQGLWPAFWLLGSNITAVGWPQCGELDVMENHGSDVTSTSSAMHGPGYSGNTPFVHSYQLAAGSFAEDFHTFALEWNSSRVVFFVDGKQHYVIQRDDVQRRGNWVFDQPFFIILNLAVGGTFDGDPRSDTILPATMLVDYVRVYR